MEGKFDEALVERLAKALHALEFVTPSPSSAEVSELWDESSLSYKGIHRIHAKYLLSSLSETHAIVPKEEYAKIIDTLRNVRSDLIERICNRCDHNCSGCEEVYPHRARIEEILAKEAYCLRWKV